MPSRQQSADIALTKTRQATAGERHPPIVLGVPYIAAEIFANADPQGVFASRGPANSGKPGRRREKRGYKSVVNAMSCGWSPRYF